MPASSTQGRAGNALAVSIKGLRTSRKKLEVAISMKKLDGKSFKDEMREKARVSRKLAVIRDRKALFDAGSTVVDAPSFADINAVKQTIRSVEAAATAGAAWRAGFKAVKTLAASSGKLGGEVKLSS
ncbi:MAG: hypothetical protein AAF495_01525 [Pseudomonadota bacterium]